MRPSSCSCLALTTGSGRQMQTAASETGEADAEPSDAASPSERQGREINNGKEAKEQRRVKRKST